jgi:hypothetical protein
MSYEEQSTFLEQTVQEIGRTCQGTATSESSEEIGDPREDIEVAMVHPGSPVPIRDSPEDQAAQERGTLLHQQTELLMKQMWDDLYIFISPVVSTTVQSVPTESNDPGSTVPR